MKALRFAHNVSSHLSDTVGFYDRNAEQYATSTRDLDMSGTYERFLKYLKPGSRILDAGSGSGRDTLEFLKRGYAVEAFDASISLANISSRLTGIRTRVLRFEDFNDVAQFDGIWSCAALLHVSRSILSDVLNRLLLGLKHNGVLYASFKYGTEDRVAKDGRQFADLDETGLADILQQVACKHEVLEMWVAQGAIGRFEQTMWLNAIIKRNG